MTLFSELAIKLLATSEGFTPHAWLVAVVCILFIMNLLGGILLIIYCREHGALLPMPGEKFIEKSTFELKSVYYIDNDDWVLKVPSSH